MTEEKYSRLNEYLNNCFLQMADMECIFIDHLKELCILSDQIKKSFNVRIESYHKENHLTFEDIFLLAREVIAILNPDYLKEYDVFISNGMLDFDNSEDSHYNSITNSINVSRKFNYSDVGTLVHEFFHYTNVQIGHSKHAEFLTEFISIYFQEYTKRYLLEEKQINKEEIDMNGRIIDFLYCNDRFNKYCYLLLAFAKGGNLNSNTPNKIEETFGRFDNSFENECLSLLEELEKIKSNTFSFEDTTKKMIEKITTGYKYVVGTVLAFYALEYCNPSDIIRLNKKINSAEYASMSIEEVLETIGITIDEDFIDAAIQCIKKNIESSRIIK